LLKATALWLFCLLFAVFIILICELFQFVFFRRNMNFGGTALQLFWLNFLTLPKEFGRKAVLI